VLSGRYALIVSQLPVIPKPASKTGRKILAAAVAYLDATKQRPDLSESELDTQATGQIRIAKVSAAGAEVDVLWTPPALWEGEIQDQMSTLIQDAVDRKHRKLENAEMGSGEAILLLYDAYGYGEPSDAVAATRQLNGCDWFHSIFWAASFCHRKNTTYPNETGRGGLFLCSHNPAWSGRGTVRLGSST